MNYDGDVYALTDDEIKFGLGALLNASYEEEEETDDYYDEINDEEEQLLDEKIESKLEIDEYINEDKETKEINLESEIIYFSDRQISIINLISGLSTNKEIKEKTIKHLILYDIEKASISYMRKENLPLEYFNITKQNNGLVILLKIFLKNKCYITLTKEYITNIEDVAKYIYSKKTMITYDKVTIFRNFIHKKIIEYYGVNSHLELNKTDMKNILSSARLHIELLNIKQLKSFDLILLIKKHDERAKQESIKPIKPIFLLTNQKYEPYWKVKNNHIQSPFEQLVYSKLKLISKINNIKMIQPIDDYKQNIIDVFK